MSDPHKPIQASEEISEFEVLELALRELAIEKGLFSAEDHRRFSEWAESIGPSGGSKLVAKAWTDPEFKSDCSRTAPRRARRWVSTGVTRPAAAHRATTRSSTFSRTPPRCTT